MALLKFSNLPKTPYADDNDLLLVETSNGTKTISKNDLIPHADLSINDETDPRYVKNRTHYENLEKLVRIPETVGTVEDEMIYFDYSLLPWEINYKLIIVFDGVEYETTCEENSDGCYEYGFNVDNSYISFWDNGAIYSIGSSYLSNGDTHTYEIYEYTGIVKQLDEKFIPDNLKAGRIVTGIEYYLDDGSTSVASKGAEVFNNYEGNIAIGKYSHAEGTETNAIGYASHAEGWSSKANGTRSHAEGNSIANGDLSHAEGHSTANGDSSHAEGESTIANGPYSHAEGFFSNAEYHSSHAEGYYTVASGLVASHSEGDHTIASSKSQHVQGKYNIEDANDKYAHIVGNGSNRKRSNAHTLDWEGNAWFAGDVYINSTSGINKDEGSKKLATEEYIDIRVPAWTDADEGKILQIVNGTPTWISLS